MFVEPTSPSAEDWLNRAPYIHTVQFCAAVQRNEDHLCGGHGTLGYIVKWKKSKAEGLPRGPLVKTARPTQGEWVPSWVGELKFHMLCSAVKKKKSIHHIYVAYFLRKLWCICSHFLKAAMEEEIAHIFKRATYKKRTRWRPWVWKLDFFWSTRSYTQFWLWDLVNMWLFLKENNKALPTKEKNAKNQSIF